MFLITAKIRLALVEWNGLSQHIVINQIWFKINLCLYDYKN